MPKETFSALQSQIKKLQQKADAIQAKQRGPVLASLVRSMRDYGITVEELSDALEKRTATPRKTRGRPAAEKGANKTVRQVAPKYRHPDTGDTWTGRGKAPRWLSAAEASGASREDFIIKA